MNQNVLITGGAGFIGTHLCRTLVAQGFNVHSLDLKGKPNHPVEGVRYETGDARNLAHLSQMMKQHDLRNVYHLAATVSVPLCQKNPLESYSHNLTATLSVLEAAKQYQSYLGAVGKVRLAFASSAALYGNLGNDRKPLTEKSVADRFNSFYAAQKHGSEKMIELYSSFFKIPALIFRFFNVYGEGQDPNSPYSGVITIFTKLAKEKKALKLDNSGIQTRDFIPVTVVARAIASALKLPAEKWDASIINLGSGVPTSIRELAETIRSVLGNDCAIEDAPPREGDVLHSLADIRRARELLDFELPAGLAIELSALLTMKDSEHTQKLNA